MNDQDGGDACLRGRHSSYSGTGKETRDNQTLSSNTKESEGKRRDSFSRRRKRSSGSTRHEIRNYYHNHNGRREKEKKRQRRRRSLSMSSSLSPISSSSSSSSFLSSISSPSSSSLAVTPPSSPAAAAGPLLPLSEGENTLYSPLHSSARTSGAEVPPSSLVRTSEGAITGTFGVCHDMPFVSSIEERKNEQQEEDRERKKERSERRKRTRRREEEKRERKGNDNRRKNEKRAGWSRHQHRNRSYSSSFSSSTTSSSMSTSSCSSSSCTSSTSSSSSSRGHPSEDWVCAVCANINSLHRDPCFRCGVRFRFANRPHSCAIQASHVPHHLSKEELMQALEDVAKKSTLALPPSVMGSRGKKEGDGAGPGSEVVVGGGWSWELNAFTPGRKHFLRSKKDERWRRRMKREAMSIDKHKKTTRMREEEGEKIEDGKLLLCHHRDGNEKETKYGKAFHPRHSSSSSFFFLFSSRESALNILIASHCQLKVVRKIQSEPKGDLFPTSPSFSSPPPSDTEGGNIHAREENDTTVLVPLCFPSPASRREGALMRMFHSNLPPRSGGGREHTKAATNHTGAVSSSAPTASVGGLSSSFHGSSASASSAVPPPVLLPASLNPFTWVAPTSFPSFEEEEAYLNLLGDYWEHLSSAQKTFYNQSIPGILLRKASGSLAEPSLTQPTTNTPTLPSDQGGPPTLTVLRSSKDHPAPLPPSCESDTPPLPPFAFDVHQHEGNSTIQIVTDPTSASLLARAREKLARRKAAAKEACGASEIPSSASLLSSTSTSSSTTASGVTALPSSAEALNSSPSLTPATGTAIRSTSLPLPSSTILTTGARRGNISLSNGGKENNDTGICTSFLSTHAGRENGGSAKVSESPIQTLSCHSGFAFPPMPALTPSFLFSPIVKEEMEVKHSHLDSDVAQQDDAEKSAAAAARQHSFEISWPIAMRIFNNSLFP